MLTAKDDSTQIQYMDFEFVRKEFDCSFDSVTSPEKLIRGTRVWRVFRLKTTYLTPERQWSSMVEILSDII